MINKNLMIPVGLIIIFSLFSYFNVFQNEFVWDDHVFILDNQDIRSFSNFPIFFNQDVDGLYRPLRSLHYTLIYSIAGKDEFIYHINSIFFHILISILIYFIIFEVVEKRNIALISALIFAVHPVHTGRVTNITASFDLFGIFFMLLSFYLYIKYSKLSFKKYLFFSLIFFIIAIFASEEAITLPFLIILYEFCFNKENLHKKNIKIYLPYLIFGFFYFMIRFFVLGIRGRVQEYLAGNFFLTMLTMLKVYVYYIYLLIVPINLTLFHEIEPVSSIFDLKVLFSLLFLITILVFTLKFYKNKIIFFSVFWFFITLIPFSNILPLQIFMAERYLYVPSIAFSLLISYFLIKLFNFKIPNKKIFQYGAGILIIILLVFYIFSTVNRNNDWKDNLTLWSKTVETNPGDSKAHDNLGFTYERSGNVDKALEEFELAVKLQPDNYRALANLGVVYAKLKKYDKSIDSLEKSNEMREYHKTYDKLGLVYVELEDEKRAIESFLKAIEINQRYAKAHNDLATVYGSIGEFDLALQEFEKAIKIDRDYADAHYNLGVLLEFLEQDKEAKEEFQIAVSLEPENELYRKKLGR